MSDISSEVGGRGIGVTIKYGKGYDETWSTFRGLPAEIREDIVAYFGLDPEATEQLSLNELVVNATQVAHGVTTAATLLGAVVIPSSDAPAEGTSVWEQAAAEPAEPAVDPIFSAIERAQNVEELKVVWADNQAKFSEPNVMEAYKSRGKELQAAAVSE